MAICDQRHANVGKQTIMLDGVDIGPPKRSLCGLGLNGSVHEVRGYERHLKCKGSSEDSQSKCKYMVIKFYFIQDLTRLSFGLKYFIKILKVSKFHFLHVTLLHLNCEKFMLG